MVDYEQDDEDYYTKPLIEQHDRVVEEYLKRLGELIQEVVQLRATENRLQGWYDKERDKVLEWRNKFKDAVEKRVAETEQELANARKDYEKRGESLDEAKEMLKVSGQKAKSGEAVYVASTKWNDDVVVFKSEAKARAFCAKHNKSNSLHRYSVDKKVVV